jgi:hypothetical protein
MNMKAVASSLICAILLLTVAPSKAFAQTLGQPAPGERTSNVAGAKPQRDLKARFAAEVASARADTSASEREVRLDRERLRPQSSPKSRFSNRDVVLAVVAVVVIVGLAIVLVHNGVNPSPSCDDEPLTPGCVR